MRVLSDGYYLIFGTTYIINEKKLMLMKVNQETGKLESTGKKIDVGGSVCVRFLALE